MEKNRQKIRVKKCLNCGFIFKQGKLRRALGKKHPGGYYNPYSPIPDTPFIEEICPNCGSDAITEIEV